MNERILIVEDDFIVAGDLASMVENAGYHVCATTDTVRSAKEAIEKHRPTWVLLDIFLQDDSLGTDLAPYLQEKGIGFIYISANTNQSVLETAKATQPYGFLVKPFREKDLLLMLEIARGKHASILELSAQRESFLQQSLWSLADEYTPHINKLDRTPAAFQSVIPFDLMVYNFHPYGQDEASAEAFQRIGYSEYQALSGVRIQPSDSSAEFKSIENDGEVAASAKVIQGASFTLTADVEFSKKKQTLNGDFRATLQFECKNKDGVLQLGFFSKNQDSYDRSHEKLLSRSEKVIYRLFKQLSHKPLDKSPNVPRRAVSVQPPGSNIKFEGIVGHSTPLLEVLDQVKLVATTNVTVLILGESGTGKEKIAYNVHLLSSRKSKPFITINCAAMPADLIESELFGHEKGAFTGANERRIGKLEAANGGTVFLDEIGELPLESQVKLLRFLQEKHFERIGSSKTISVDIRIIAATNRNLEKEVGEGRFRLDLFYRLNVYPVTLPPLRERGEDILILAKHFTEKTATALGRKIIPEFSARVLRQLSEYQWPGNIRELEHLMERTLIKTQGQIIDSVELPTVTSGKFLPSFGADANKTLHQIEIEHILSVLKRCNGRVNGPGGAAEILGLPPSTLNSKMKKLGIKRTSSYGN
ncbi:sigma 54-interacting transcriptional regulator [Dyadobacter sp. CY261]|uniref:sigma-54 dependent transcriptional regulator n=1 Tax=Dyadobacter sp. CY261 TaxID=2907203 RepID=UPI001F1F4970|nr:sigma 54-interacting transcriptional regulator [Dyadobacter sp. CY261]MCF0075557.1 sigma 54-interacting transcriptional regulator [Dyadobacter sp. CY261]